MLDVLYIKIRSELYFIRRLKRATRPRLTQPKIRRMTGSFCRGVLKAITSDHNTSNAKERERVIAMGGSIKDNR